jgi:hypothetical protein
MKHGQKRGRKHGQNGVGNGVKNGVKTTICQRTKGVKNHLTVTETAKHLKLTRQACCTQSKRGSFLRNAPDGNGW